MPSVTLEQVRARRAYDAVRQDDQMIDLTESLPTMLQINGLLATWAFLLGKQHDSIPHRSVLRVLSEHLWRFEGNAGNVPQPRATFVTWIGDGQGQLSGWRMRRLTEEAIAFSAWLKRAGQALGRD